MDTTGSQWPFRVNWRVTVGLGAVSVITMPLTAIWFLLAGLLGLTAAGSAAVLASPRPPAGVVDLSASVALGLLVGPTIYLALAAVT